MKPHRRSRKPPPQNAMEENIEIVAGPPEYLEPVSATFTRVEPQPADEWQIIEAGPPMDPEEAAPWFESQRKQADLGPVGAELRVHASGPMPRRAAEHLRSLITVIPKAERTRPRRPRRENLQEITDPVIARALTLADEHLTRIEEEFARRKERIEPGRPDSTDPSRHKAQLAKLARRVREVVEAARAAGVDFTAR